MGWFVGVTLASLVAGVIIVKIFDYFFAGMVGGFASTIRACLFVGTWTAITAKSGMHGVTGHVRQLRQGKAKMVEALAKVSGPRR